MVFDICVGGRRTRLHAHNLAFENVTIFRDIAHVDGARDAHQIHPRVRPLVLVHSHVIVLQDDAHRQIWIIRVVVVQDEEIVSLELAPRALDTVARRDVAMRLRASWRRKVLPLGASGRRRGAQHCDVADAAEGRHRAPRIRPRMRQRMRPRDAAGRSGCGRGCGSGCCLRAGR